MPKTPRKRKGACKYYCATCKAPNPVYALASDHDGLRWCKGCKVNVPLAVLCHKTYCKVCLANPTVKPTVAVMGYPDDGFHGRQWCRKHMPVGAEDVVNVQRCEHNGCRTRPTFGAHMKDKRRWCLSHVPPEGGINVIDKRCEHPGCGTIPSFGFEHEGRKKWCVTHKPTGAVDVGSKKCEHGVCTRHASFGLLTERKKRWCAEHGPEGAICVGHKGCTRCEKRAYFGEALDQLKQWCRTHKTKTAIDLVHNVCEVSGCSTQAGFHLEPDPIARWCGKHKPSQAINSGKKCLEKGCGVYPTFGPDATTQLWCYKHQPPNSLCFRYYKSCEQPACSVIPTFGFPSEGRSRWCFRHKPDNATDVNHPTCDFVTCNTRPSFGFETGIKRWCQRHKPEDAIDVNSRPVCEHPQGCSIRPSYAFEFADTPRWCLQHRQKDSINIVGRQCEETDCQTQPRYGLPDSIRSRWCKSHGPDHKIYLGDYSCTICHVRRGLAIAGKGVICATCIRGKIWGSSVRALLWLQHISSSRDVTLQTAQSPSGEHRIRNSRYRADGYCSATNTVFEFHGCYWHGCPSCQLDREALHPTAKKTFEQLWEDTETKRAHCLAVGYQYECIWECQAKWLWSSTD